MQLRRTDVKRVAKDGMTRQWISGRSVLSVYSTLLDFRQLAQTNSVVETLIATFIDKKDRHNLSQEGGISKQSRPMEQSRALLDPSGYMARSQKLVQIIIQDGRVLTLQERSRTDNCYDNGPTDLALKIFKISTF